MNRHPIRQAHRFPGSDPAKAVELVNDNQDRHWVGYFEEVPLAKGKRCLHTTQVCDDFGEALSLTHASILIPRVSGISKTIVFNR